MQPPLLQVGPLHPSPAQGGGEADETPPQPGPFCPSISGAGSQQLQGGLGGSLGAGGHSRAGKRGRWRESQHPPKPRHTAMGSIPTQQPREVGAPPGLCPPDPQHHCTPGMDSLEAKQLQHGGGVGGQGWRVEQPGAGDPEASLCRAQRSRMAQGELPGSYIQDEGSGALYQRGGLLGEVNAHHHSCPQADPARTPPFPWGKQRSGDTDGGRAEHWAAPGGSPVLCPQPEVPTPGAPSHCPPPTHRVLLGAAIS